MSCFTFTAWRRPLATVQARPCTSQRPALSIFSGLHNVSLPVSRPATGTGSLLFAPQNGGRVFAMRHGKRVPRLGRPADQRKALIRGLVTEVLRHGKIKTTQVKAKAIRKYVDKMITLAKDNSLHARRQVLGFVYDKEIVSALFEEAPKRYGDRTSGYCRVIREAQRRRGDAAPMAIIELV